MELRDDATIATPDEDIDSSETASGALSGADILCFAKDWTEDPTSNNHVMRSLSRHNRVLWLNSIATRTPDVRRKGDVRKLGRKLKSFARGPVQISPTLSVATPMVLPFPHSRAAVAFNRHILPLEAVALTRQLGLADVQLWTFLPTAVDYLGRLGESLVVYYCTDEWTELPGIDAKRISRMEAALCERADLVFVTSPTLLEAKRRYNPETYLAPHGVDHAHFARALDDETEIASELAALPQPILGFVGLIEEWVDLALIGKLAEARPGWSFVLVGRSAVDTTRLQQHKNVHLLGRRPYAELPRLLKGFSVGLIPFVESELTRNVNPIKLPDILSAGLPVVSTRMPAVEAVARADGHSCVIARTPEEFLKACERILAHDTSSERRRRSRSMRTQTWDHRVAALGERVRHAQAIRRRRH